MEKKQRGQEEGGEEEGGNRGGKAHLEVCGCSVCEGRAGVCLPGAKGAVEHREDSNGASSSQNELGKGQSDQQRGVAVEEANPEGLAGEQHCSPCAGSRLRSRQGQLLPGWEPPARAGRCTRGSRNSKCSKQGLCQCRHSCPEALVVVQHSSHQEEINAVAEERGLAGSK